MARDTWGSVWVSYSSSSTVLLRIPPSALISSMAILIPSRQLVPAGAPAPDSSATMPSLTVSSAVAVPAVAMTAAERASRYLRYMNIPPKQVIAHFHPASYKHRNSLDKRKRRELP